MPRLTDHKTIGFAYGIAAGVFMLVGFLLMLLFRWQLAWPGQPIPIATAIFGETNAPGGILLPEFYYQLVAMHGSVMIFLAVVPLLTGALGSYLVPLQIGAPGLAFPRLSRLAFLLYLTAGLVMAASFALPGGAANSGWTSYPPLSIIASSGQTVWLAGVLMLGASSTLLSLTILATIVAYRAPGLTLLRLPFFVWAQAVTALLLLLSFPPLQAAAVFQLMDRVAGTSFFLPSGLAVSNTPLAVSGGGNPLLWQHLFWFLAHPEVYVLVLPAMGIVAEVLTSHARRNLWRYGLMVAAVVGLGAWSMVVWAHHMYLTGMGTTLSSFFQITTMTVSVPSVILITCLVVTLWGGAIRFTTAMLFALAFLPMFGIGGVTGLPLGLAPTNLMLHDTYYVLGHFHYLVAPGTMFAIFAAIYHWFPKMTGRRLNETLGVVHFAGSFVGMNAVFLPMFFMGLMGVNRRLYDGGLQYELAQPALAWNAHMTWAAVALGLFQLVFLWNIVRSARRGEPADNPWRATTLEWTSPSPPPPGNFVETPVVAGPPYRYEEGEA
ncbi:MAG: cbb3-type cytochrome c oxidase subunit I [Vicinamibacterales bacterium]